MQKTILILCRDGKFLLELTQSNFWQGMWGDDSWGKTATGE